MSTQFRNVPGTWLPDVEVTRLEGAFAEVARQIARSTYGTCNGFSEPPIEKSFKLPGAFAMMLFMAISRAHGIEPYRPTKFAPCVRMIKGPKAAVHLLEGHYDTLQRAMDDHILAVLIHLIDILNSNDQDLPERNHRLLH